ncbi:hypothetical protein [Aliikangiella maris]|uniref:Uncharacterized protein n=2 Tax=Aliikangiella maris TaxID=3162458 RepID=A0ABV3MIG2_9GAMM
MALVSTTVFSQNQSIEGNQLKPTQNEVHKKRFLNNQTQAQVTVEQWVKFWNNYNLDQLPNLFIQDKRLTYFSSETQGLIRSYNAIVKHHQGFGFVPKGKTQQNKLWLTDIEYQPLGDTAYQVTAIWHFKNAIKNTLQTGPVSLTLLKESNQFKIVHAHFANY